MEVFYCIHVSVTSIMEAEALHDFNATAADELAFSRGDVLNVRTINSAFKEY